MSDSLQSNGLQHTRLLCPWDFPGRSTGVGCHCLLPGCESQTIKKTELWRTDAFELWSWRRLEHPLDRKEIKLVNLKGNQPWIFIGRTDAVAEAPILWLPDVKSQLTGKDPDAGKDGSQKEKGLAENEMVRWDHQLNGHGFGRTPGVGDG